MVSIGIDCHGFRNVPSSSSKRANYTAFVVLSSQTSCYMPTVSTKGKKPTHFSMNVCHGHVCFFGCYIFIIQWYTNQVTSLQKPHRKKVSQETWGFNPPSSIHAGHILSAPSSWKRRTITVTVTVTVTITQTTQTRQMRHPFGSVTCASVVLCWSLGLGCWVGGFG